MSVERVRAFLERKAPAISVTELEEPTATVSQAAEAFKVQPGQIAKSLSFRVNNAVIVLVMAGDYRLNNKKFKDYFGVKARMLPSEEVLDATGFTPGGVSPLGINAEVAVYCDESLRNYEEVLPSGGNGQSGVRISPDTLAYITGATWVGLCGK
ncbi:YbaK/EbsC family protein [Rosenbergiella epipactidis]|uniref:YbaK/EbsC family protein n=1 Tax=Rosenbergiella epipactidis TaxID=1544694 RepID=UPI0006646C41|nr:YbaK/EbsC family protein [Rosenbergiella epipactidis]KMV71207.1 prolyl-tRNA synthetase [bacteria symbiont BFo2 of Frankliniella occidentalis]KYP90604.1 prolyl-tRNA synthetase [bacteria symbiont BFo2 of Frankliniella occidentalis]KYP94459.1 prolyl-tRNA synthetase [bacteria symbiont BFo2 of Frankliniella occidentalis]